jgi:pilus assembly protein CpaB
MVSGVLLQDIRVLAIGRRMVEAAVDTPYVDYASVTLEVKPSDGVIVINADEEGIVSLMLHSRVADEQTKNPEQAAKTEQGAKADKQP